MKHVFNKCSKNSPTSSGGEMNCTSETTSVNLNEKLNSSCGLSQ